MTRPSAPCARISSTIVQWKNFATLPHCRASLFSMSRHSVVVGSGCRAGGAVAHAFGLDADADLVADFRGVAGHAEVLAPERGRGREADHVAQRERIGG